MLITESNRYLNESLGLVRLKALFQRAREQAPNILFIRDMDFMTRHRNTSGGKQLLRHRLVHGEGRRN